MYRPLWCQAAAQCAYWHIVQQPDTSKPFSSLSTRLAHAAFTKTRYINSLLYMGGTKSNSKLEPLLSNGWKQCQQSILKATSAMCMCRVTWQGGIGHGRNHIFVISDPNLPIHYTTTITGNLLGESHIIQRFSKSRQNRAQKKRFFGSKGV